MTSDAKIGLLLGLVFIFVIAFIINGLPNLKPQQTIHANVPTIVGFSDPEVGVGGQAQAQAERDWSALANEQESAPVVQTPVEQVAPMVQTPLQQPETANSQDVRYETLLPGAEAVSPRTDSPLSRIDNPLARIENLLERFTAGQQSQTTSTINMAPEHPATVERQPTVQTQQPRTEVRPTETVTRTAEQLRPAGTASARPVGKIYVVGEGESLSTVAKKVYGPEEGNRYVNINRIYEANKDILKSVHEVVAGQKLVIPPLPKPTANPNKPSDVLSRDLFEKVETINKRPAAQTQPQTAPVAAGSFRWYTVQDGDNLWKIASSQLGAGARYDEIAKLNTDVLKNGEKLDLGMKIRLPLK